LRVWYVSHTTRFRLWTHKGKNTARRNVDKSIFCLSRNTNKSDRLDKAQATRSVSFTFPLDKVAHARVAIKHLLRDIAHNFATLFLAVKRVPAIVEPISAVSCAQKKKMTTKKKKKKRLPL
jgi:hypothetical protein